MLQVALLLPFLVLSPSPVPRVKSGDSVIVDRHGAIIRGDVRRKEIALVFTGDEFGDGGESIRTTLRKRGAKASFFLTGRFYSNRKFRSLLEGLRADGHYLGGHSDQHLLYADWTKRDSLLVTRDQFSKDLEANYDHMASFGVTKGNAQYFLPPYEWYNSKIAEWTRALGLCLVNFTPGTRSHADYTYPDMGTRYVPSDVIYRSIMDYERRDPNGLNGFILLVHIGTDPRREDKFYHRLDELVSELQSRGYLFLTITELLKTKCPY